MNPRSIALAAVGLIAATVVVVAPGGQDVELDYVSDRAHLLADFATRVDCDDLLATGGNPPGGGGPTSSDLNARVASGEIAAWHAGGSPDTCTLEILGATGDTEKIAKVTQKARMRVRSGDKGRRPGWSVDARGCRTHVWAGEDPCAGIDAGPSP